jgi:protein-S-isoprenylcysteine O-methyltransferase Ste14
MYVGVLTALAGETVLFEGQLMVEYALTVWFGVHLFVCLYEEPTLTRRYGDQYLHYKSHVPRWLPRFPAWKGPAQ